MPQENEVTASHRAKKTVPESIPTFPSPVLGSTHSTLLHYNLWESPGKGYTFVLKPTITELLK